MTGLIIDNFAGAVGASVGIEAAMQAAQEGALFVLNDSGGKDSQAMRLFVRDMVPREQIVVVHASLGDVEWSGAMEHARDGAKRDGMAWVVARATKTFFEMVERRHAARPDVPCWPSAQHRQCTSDLKRVPIEREVRRYLKRCGRSIVVNCMGIRSAESHSRAKLEPWRYNQRNSKAGRTWYDWLPIYGMTREEVFASIDAAGEQPHHAYSQGNERLSCMFCIFGSRGDLRNAAAQNPGLYRRYVEMEERTGYTMHQSRVPLRVLVEGGAS